MTEHLNLSGVSHGYGDRQLLDGIGLVITAGDHVAIVGENGAGKSTLLRILAGLEAPDEGTAVSHGRVGYLAQTHGLPESFTVGAAVDSSLASLRALEAELDRLEAGLADAEDDELETYGRLQTEYQLREGYAAESRVEAALDRLGLGGLDRKRTLGSLSGGEQERVALACVLADPADILLLDEPTNHLDARGTAWLEDRLAAHRGTVVVVSHDRVLLRKVASTVIEVDAERLAVTRYGNGYDGYLREKAAERQRWVQQYHEWIDAMDAEQRQADTVTGKMGYARQRDNDKVGFDFKAGTWQKAASSKVRNAQERLRRLEASPIDRPPVPLRLAAELAVDPEALSAALAAPMRSGAADLAGDSLLPASAVLVARGVAVPGRLGVTDFAARAGEKILITGPNGAGKSTLLSVLAGTLEPVEGSVQRPARIGYLQQELELPQRPALRLLPAFAAGLGGNIDEHAEALLRLGLFRTSEFHVPVGSLSAGQQRRLALARLLLGGYGTLIVDEPTNHLAPVLVEQLEEALVGFTGTLVMVSHDRALRDWFARCAKKSDTSRTDESGRWIRYSMDKGVLAPA
ncbi:ABC-F family ATP-binding cassette domain-containing protein [Pseudarthrobacter sp. AL07]|uniref:ABC-F family ATP-binding cassette domain-containing protein n=1 Tax=unclassified Pseudarthrobacter TaxID=2647000 RepID=UPI002499C97A|nr:MULTISPECIES: ABC-F family ATP-binding cassette domain-containing protein [unclassified Pseudarthrobacter]MDI3194328.1 ABC-F family ATP-binding cassette domain-containing protein [Pseudarthrobacter sp. AL20]MDI3208395.1 ABC-F family ATP-binding cassette domain-containing protein [Pseudarthrobacter sp. AL07]